MRMSGVVWCGFVDWHNKIKMDKTSNEYQMLKNKRRLVTQNLKLHAQLTQIQSHVAALLNETDPEPQPPSINPYQAEIAQQQKTIRQLRARIEQFKLERAKDNVEYIVHEEDDLKIAKKKQLQLMDQKEVLTRKMVDKNSKLKEDLPYQHYEEKFQEELMQVIHHNRDQAMQITEIQREIRKYHMMRKTKSQKQTPRQHIPTQADVAQLEQAIQLQLQMRKQLQKQWKPHLNQLDEQFARLLHEASLKKEAIAELQREERAYETRMSAIRDAEEIAEDRKRIGQLHVSSKLKQQLMDLQEEINSKNTRKVNPQKLKYAFITKEEPSKAPAGAKDAAPQEIKKKDEKIIQTMHNDKNITKKVEKGLLTKKPVAKVDQVNNTDITLPHNKRKYNKDKEAKDAQLLELNKKFPDEERNYRLWESRTETAPFPPSKEAKPLEQQNPYFVRMREVGSSTDVSIPLSPPAPSNNESL